MARWRPPDGRDADGRRNATKRGPDKPTRARQTDVSVEHRGYGLDARFCDFIILILFNERTTTSILVDRRPTLP